MLPSSPEQGSCVHFGTPAPETHQPISRLNVLMCFVETLFLDSQTTGKSYKMNSSSEKTNCTVDVKT